MMRFISITLMASGILWMVAGGMLMDQAETHGANVEGVWVSLFGLVLTFVGTLLTVRVFSGRRRRGFHR